MSPYRDQIEVSQVTPAGVLFVTEGNLKQREAMNTSYTNKIIYNGDLQVISNSYWKRHKSIVNKTKQD